MYVSVTTNVGNLPHRLVLRIRADDPNAVCQLGVKFGCSLSDGKELLNTAKELGLNVVGVR